MLSKNAEYEEEFTCYTRGKRSTRRTVSAFITKLYSMVNDRLNKHLISWNPAGTSFLVCNATRFSQEILPVHFKHSNYASFIRQLNMYGFHKINKSPRGQRGNDENEIWEFSHPKFQRGHAYLLHEIKRKAMDSEVLRRETGDIHASFAMIQVSQAELLQQYNLLQENFNNLLRAFEETKEIQWRQEMMIRKLMERDMHSTHNMRSLHSAAECISPSSFPDLGQPMPTMTGANEYETTVAGTNGPFLTFQLDQSQFPPSPVSSDLLTS
ncbi:hypothetical protein EC973_008590 [Apophysomyces ossiformis]|uniref:HSF-type DNA-binding domain-containing protein n=1 Tax=Apophysomyces ossiformis TaxID=679940 RepID=A0A8H7ETK6_9FUNG|nr:hypothetical protein EC973_008590 [Apophysomyces ossiformis]